MESWVFSASIAIVNHFSKKPQVFSLEKGIRSYDRAQVMIFATRV